jgi:hypothetical protein
MTTVQAATERNHEWHEPDSLIKYPYCSKCLTIKRRDGRNGPCKGPGKLRAMEKPLSPPPRPDTLSSK